MQTNNFHNVKLCRRREFSPEDDNHLVRYLSLVTPDPAAGGRMGYHIYNQLMTLACLLSGVWRSKADTCYHRVTTGPGQKMADMGSTNGCNAILHPLGVSAIRKTE